METPLPSSKQQQQPSSSPPVDVEAAVRELTKGHELASELQSLLREVIPRGDGRLESACRISKDVQQTLLSALSILRPTRTARFRSSDPLALEIRLPCSESEESRITTAADLDADDKNHQKHSKKRNLCSVAAISYETSNEGHCKANGEKKTNKSKVQRNHLNSWTAITCTPFNDGHQWRKYGEKKISNCKMPRCYYRCTHKDDQGCQATKQVQQKDNEDPPKYVVTYNKQHTCKKIDLLLSEEFVLEGGKFVIEPPPPISDPCQLSL